MSNRFINRKQIIVILVLFCVFSCLAPVPIQAEEMSSETYRLQTDDISIGAIGEMRDFYNFNQREGPVSEDDLKDGSNFHFAWKLLLGIAGGLLLLIFLYYFTFKKRLFSKQ